MSPVAPPLRIALMLDSFVVPRWIAAVIEQVIEESLAEPVLVILNDEEPDARGWWSRLRQLRPVALFALYQRLDARLFARDPDAFTPVDLRDCLGSVPVRHVRPLRPRPYEHRFEAADINAVCEAEVDVLLRFGFRIIRGEILGAARYGVWSYHHGDTREYRGGPAGFWEMYERNPTTGTTLQLLTDELDGGRVLYRSVGATDPTSLWRTRNVAYWKGSHFVSRCLRELRARGFDHLSSRPHFDDPGDYRKPIYRTPGNFQMVRFLARLVAGVAARRIQNSIRREQWQLLFRRHPDGLFKPILPPRDRFYADPFLIRRDGRTYIFFEELPWASGRGVISYVRLADDDTWTAPKRALDVGRHISYPCLMEWDGEVFMVPETWENRAIELYRAKRFPDEWVQEAVLVEGVRAVDPTLFHANGRFWMFANVAEDGMSPLDELVLFHAEELHGPWQRHPQSPVVSDIRSARPAGAVFEREGSLIRPSQDCSTRYGGAIVFNRIETLTTDEYAERCVGRIDPGEVGGVAAHSYATDGEWEVIDYAKSVLRWP